LYKETPKSPHYELARVRRESGGAPLSPIPVSPNGSEGSKRWWQMKKSGGFLREGSEDTVTRSPGK